MYPKLEEKLKELDWKTEDMAVLLKTSQWKAYHRRRGDTPFSPLEQETLSRFLKVPVKELFEEEKDV